MKRPQQIFFALHPGSFGARSAKTTAANVLSKTKPKTHQRHESHYENQILPPRRHSRRLHRRPPRRAVRSGRLPLWDGLTPAGAPGGGAGNWNTALTNWDTSLAGGDVAWNNANLDTAVFGSAVGAVALTAPITVGGLTFYTTAYVITATSPQHAHLRRWRQYDQTQQHRCYRCYNHGNRRRGASANLILTGANSATGGTLTLNGTSTGGWGGTTTIGNNKTLALSGLNQGLNSTTGITLNTGNITLTNTAATAVENNRISDSAAITANGGTFNGTGVWTAGASGNWAVNGNWTDANTVNAAPGTFAGFDNVDTATFDGTGAGTTISLNGTSPSVKTVAFSGGVAYTIDNTGGGTLTMKSNAGDATISSSSTVTETISAPVALASNTTVSVTGAGLLSTTGNISQTGGDKTLTKDGTGTLDLNGTLQAYKTLTVNDGTANVNGTLGVTPGTAVVSVTDTAGGVATKLRFGTVSQTLSSLTIGAGATVIFTSGAASGSFSGGGGKAPSLGGSAVVPEPGTLGLLLVGALGVLGRRRRA